MDAYLYSLIRYVPDPARGEQVNIGVVVAREDPPFLRARFIGQQATGRLKRLGFTSNFRFIKDLADEMAKPAPAQQLAIAGRRETWTLETLQAAVVEWANTIQFSDLRAALHAQPDSLLDQLFARYVADPQPRRSRARDRQWVKRKVSQSLRQAVLAVRPEADVRQLIRRDPRIEGEFEAHQFDYGLSNGELRRLVHTLSAEGSNRVAVKTEIDAVAWAIDDVRKARTALLIDVVAIGEGKILDSAQKVYEGLEANLVREEQVEHWSEAVALGLVTALH